MDEVMENPLVKYEIGDVAYFCHGTVIGKCRVEEIFLHFKQDETIVKYACHVYGEAIPFTFDAIQLFDDIVEPKKIAQQRMSEQFDKSIQGLSELTYESFMKQINAKKKAVEDGYIQNTSNLNKVDDEMLEEKERILTEPVKEADLGTGLE